MQRKPILLCPPRALKRSPRQSEMHCTGTPPGPRPIVTHTTRPKSPEALKPEFERRHPNFHTHLRPASASGQREGEVGGVTSSSTFLKRGDPRGTTRRPRPGPWRSAELAKNINNTKHVHYDASGDVDRPAVPQRCGANESGSVSSDGRGAGRCFHWPVNLFVNCKCTVYKVQSCVKIETVEE